MINRQTSTSLAAEDLMKEHWRSVPMVDGEPMSKYRKVLEEAVNVNSINRGFRMIQHTVVPYEQTKKGSSYFYPKKMV